MSVPDEGDYLVKVIFVYERTWWRWLPDDGDFCLWAYLMKVIPKTLHAHLIWYLRFYVFFTSYRIIVIIIIWLIN